MPGIYENIIRPCLFSQDAEKMHEYALIGFRLLSACPPACKVLRSINLSNKEEPIQLFGLTFPNKVGLAAGFDKNAECIRAMWALGFGHVEVGTLTHDKQPGNPRPRLFRYPAQEAIINRMGFNNDGALAAASRLTRLPKRGYRPTPVGVNIGKTRTVSIEDAIPDYLSSFQLLADHADYFTINVSSPNTPELRKLQGKDYLMDLLGALMQANHERAKKMGHLPTPILLKIAPDLSFPEMDSIIEVINETGIDGIIASNTTIDRPSPLNKNDEAGGLSGEPLFRKSLEVVKYIHLSTNGDLPIIASGGITSNAAAGAMVDVGASLVQIYTGMIYRGPLFARNVAKALRWHHRDW